MMRVRLADKHDLDEIVAMACAGAAPLSGPRFNSEMLRAAFAKYMAEASPTCWVTESEGALVGFMVADFWQYRARDGLFVVQEVLFVKPEKRGTVAAALMVEHLIRWAREIGAVEIVAGTEFPHEAARMAKFLRRFGFSDAGCRMRLEV